MLVYCFYLLLLGGCVAPMSLTGKHHGGLHTIGGGKMISWEPRTMISSEDYPCVKEGLYTHPTNCSRFYRCVDFTQESRIFSRYLFECPEGMVFAATIQACVPGVCPDKADNLPESSSGSTVAPEVEETTPVVAVTASSSSSVDSVGSTQEPASGGETAASVVESSTESVVPSEASISTEAAVGQSEAGSTGGSESSPGTAEKDITGLPPVIDQDQSVVSPDKVSETAEACKTKYIQHKRYCNLFHLCDDPNSLFSCYDGTAFSTERQMCRLSQFEEALCKGKEMFVPSAEVFRDAFNWHEVGVVPLDGNPVYNSNPYFFMNIGEAFEEEKGIESPLFELPAKPDEPSRYLTQPVRPFEPSKSFQTKYNLDSSTSLSQQPTVATKERKKSAISSLLGSITDLLAGNRKFTPSKTSFPKTERKTTIPKVSRRQKVSKTAKTKMNEPSSLNFSPFLNSFGDMSSFPELINTADPSKTRISTSPFMQSSISLPFTTPTVSNAGYSPFKAVGQPQSPFLNQGVQMAYVTSPSSVIYSPYQGIYPYSFNSPDISSILRTQSQSPSSGFVQAQTSSPFSPSGAFYPYSPLFSASLGMIASPYGFLYDPSRNSLIPVAIPPSYMNSIYSSLLGSNPYSSSLLQLDDKEVAEFLSSSLFSDNKPEEKFGSPKRKESITKKAPKLNIPQKYPFLINSEDASSLSSLVPAFEARNDKGETYQVIPLSQHEVDTLAQQGLLERAVKFNKPFSYDDLENLKEGEIILANFSKKKK